MRVLLDTHTFLWFIAGDSKLSAAARTLIEDGANDKLLSIASPWEIAIKASRRKLPLAEPFQVLIPREIAGNGFILLPITLDHLAAVNTLPFHHADPFDRLTAAQALVEGIPVISADPSFDAYHVTRLW
ncbi:MAG TPA: type II toxin-antitoxin system VapC family toxin [Gemmataceae bacterium]|jgi:PIN domain nuclease of toxin-antitoxin system